MEALWSAWLRRVRHDLVKRLVWPARDRKELGGTVREGELATRLIDSEGRDATAEAVWTELRAEAPDAEHAALTRFHGALTRALAAAGRDDLDGVLALDAAFDRLVRDLAKEGP